MYLYNAIQNLETYQDLSGLKFCSNKIKIILLLFGVKKLYKILFFNHVRTNSIIQKKFALMSNKLRNKLIHALNGNYINIRQEELAVCFRMKFFINKSDWDNYLLVEKEDYTMELVRQQMLSLGYENYTHKWFRCFDSSEYESVVEQMLFFKRLSESYKQHILELTKSLNTTKEVTDFNVNKFDELYKMLDMKNSRIEELTSTLVVLETLFIENDKKMKELEDESNKVIAVREKEAIDAKKLSEIRVRLENHQRNPLFLNEAMSMDEVIIYDRDTLARGKHITEYFKGLIHYLNLGLEKTDYTAFLYKGRMLFNTNEDFNYNVMVLLGKAKDLIAPVINSMSRIEEMTEDSIMAYDKYDKIFEILNEFRTEVLLFFSEDYKESKYSKDITKYEELNQENKQKVLLMFEAPLFFRNSIKIKSQHKKLEEDLRESIKKADSLEDEITILKENIKELESSNSLKNRALQELSSSNNRLTTDLTKSQMLMHKLKMELNEAKEKVKVVVVDNSDKQLILSSEAVSRRTEEEKSEQEKYADSLFAEKKNLELELKEMKSKYESDIENKKKLIKSLTEEKLEKLTVAQYRGVRTTEGYFNKLMQTMRPKVQAQRPKTFDKTNPSSIIAYYHDALFFGTNYALTVILSLRTFDVEHYKTDEIKVFEKERAAGIHLMKKVVDQETIDYIEPAEKFVDMVKQMIMVFKTFWKFNKFENDERKNELKRLIRVCYTHVILCNNGMGLEQATENDEYITKKYVKLATLASNAAMSPVNIYELKSRSVESLLEKEDKSHLERTVIEVNERMQRLNEENIRIRQDLLEYKETIALQSKKIDTMDRAVELQETNIFKNPDLKSLIENFLEVNDRISVMKYMDDIKNSSLEYKEQISIILTIFSSMSWTFSTDKVITLDRFISSKTQNLLLKCKIIEEFRRSYTELYSYVEDLVENKDAVFRLGEVLTNVVPPSQIEANFSDFNDVNGLIDQMYKEFKGLRLLTAGDKDITELATYYQKISSVVEYYEVQRKMLETTQMKQKFKNLISSIDGKIDLTKIPLNKFRKTFQYHRYLRLESKQELEDSVVEYLFENNFRPSLFKDLTAEEVKQLDLYRNSFEYFPTDFHSTLFDKIPNFNQPWIQFCRHKVFANKRYAHHYDILDKTYDVLKRIEMFDFNLNLQIKTGNEFTYPFLEDMVSDSDDEEEETYEQYQDSDDEEGYNYSSRGYSSRNYYEEEDEIPEERPRRVREDLSYLRRPGFPDPTYFQSDSDDDDPENYYKKVLANRT